MEADPDHFATITLDGKELKFKPFYAVGKAVFEGSGEAVAAARSPEDARRIAAALNSAFGIPTDALESGRRRILIVDDDQAVVDLISEVLAGDARFAVLASRYEHRDALVH